MNPKVFEKSEENTDEITFFPTVLGDSQGSRTLPRPTMCAKKRSYRFYAQKALFQTKNVISHASTIPAAPFLLPTFAPGLWGPQLPSLGRFQFIKPSFELQPISLKHSLDLKPRVDPSR